MTHILEKVNCTYGAPMGRSESGNYEGDKIHLVRIYLDSGGYDHGGAYWGHGEPLYLAYDEYSLYRFIRANSRKEAKKALNIRNAIYYR